MTLHISNRKERFLILGDFNARTGGLVDYIIGDKNDEIIPDYVPDVSSVGNRNQMDKVKCGYGEHLMDTCRSLNLKILNGRILGDTPGRLTCHKYNSSSTVDYDGADDKALGAKML